MRSRLVLEVALLAWSFNPVQRERTRKEVATRWYTWVCRYLQVIRLVACGCVTNCRIKEASLAKFDWHRFKHHRKVLWCCWMTERTKLILDRSVWIAQ